MNELMSYTNLDITVTLTFPRAMPNPMTVPNTPTSGEFMAQMMASAGTATIDTQGPLVLRFSEWSLFSKLNLTCSPAAQTTGAAPTTGSSY